MDAKQRLPINFQGDLCNAMRLYSIILRMQINLLPPALPPRNRQLHPRHLTLDIPPHTRRPTHKHTRAPPKLPLKATDHEGDIRATVLGPPAFFFLRCGHGGQEGEAHEVFLEQGRRGGESEVEI